ncbi:MAG: extracellular solute-binding protein [Oscillospiraceae bacterium]|nr:extracellular solute-binding protein [Oscillospiraceae bacterium]
MKHRILALMLAAGMLLALTACGGAAQSASAEAPDQAEASAPEEAAAPEAVPEPETAAESGSAEEISAAEEAPVEIEYGEVTYPVFEDTQDMSIFGSASAQFLGSVDMSLYSQTAAVQALEEATGVRLDYSSMTNDDVYQEKLTLMIASGDYPDFFCKAPDYYASGAAGLLEEDVCIDIAPYLDEHAPDLKRLLDEDTEYAENVYTDNGELVGVKMRAAPTTDGGGIIRQDWLEEQGLDMPETFDQLHDVLLTFKDAYGCANAIGVLSSLGSPLTFGFNIKLDTNNFSFVVHDGKVCPTIEELASREYIELLAQYYSEGLFNSDFLANYSPMMFDQMACTNETGFWQSGRMSFNGMFESYIQDDNAVIAPVKDISKTGKETSNIGGTGTPVGKNSISITTQNEYPEQSVEFINYMFTEEGIELANYGVEGQTFEYVDGEPVYTDMILNNPDGFNSNVARSLYTLNAFLPYFQPQAALEMTFTSPRMAEAEEIWMSTRSPEEYTWTLSSAEAEEYNALISAINTSIQENLTAMVMGQKPTEDWDSYIDSLYDMDLQRCIDLQQQAFDRKYGG